MRAIVHQALQQQCCMICSIDTLRGPRNVKLLSSLKFKMPWDETWVSTYQTPVLRLGARGFGSRRRNWAAVTRPGRAGAMLWCCCGAVDWAGPTAAARVSRELITHRDVWRSQPASERPGPAEIPPQHAGNSPDPELGTLGCSGQGVGLMSHLQLSWNHPPMCILNMTWSVSNNSHVSVVTHSYQYQVIIF